MAYQDLYRLSVHAAIFNDKNEILMVKTTYGAKGWTFPGGAIDPGETIHETLIRECREELGVEIEVKYLSGVYYHAAHNSQAFVFRCEIKDENEIRLSEEHSEYRYFQIKELKDSHQIKARQCLDFKGATFSEKF
jgi:8-oxo-dGTP diphosphatase